MTPDLDLLLRKSQWLRQEIFELVVAKQKGHIPSCYSMNELVVALYYGGFVKRPSDLAQRDRVVISKGHASIGLYPILIEQGLIDSKERARFTEADGQLRMYADPSIPGIESVTGSLGHGMGIACGYALAAKMNSFNYNTFAVIGDGECYEGSIWETLLFAAHHELNNFCILVDRNNLCIMDETEKCVRLAPLAEKFRAFGCDVHEIDGHRYQEILPALKSFTARKSVRPTVILAQTIKGKGISFMEGKSNWHNKMPSPAETEQARAELKKNPIKD